MENLKSDESDSATPHDRDPLPDITAGFECVQIDAFIKR